jgi:hypothetical protein
MALANIKVFGGTFQTHLPRKILPTIEDFPHCLSPHMRQLAWDGLVRELSQHGKFPGGERLQLLVPDEAILTSQRFGNIRDWFICDDTMQIRPLRSWTFDFLVALAIGQGSRP